MNNATIASLYRILTVTLPAATPQPLRTLINTALALKSDVLPQNNIIQVILTPTGTITIKDHDFGDTLSIPAGTTKILPVSNVQDYLILTSLAGTTCTVEMFFGD